MSKNIRSNYYLGLDVGTDSVGYAVTDESYHLLKFKGKSMWGSRLFDPAQTAAVRRQFRVNRRRNDRYKWRINLLQELFANAISEIDCGFFQRMKDSALWPEDKEEKQKYSLFSDMKYNDIDFYKTYPTIYHLRKDLITSDKKFDLRLIYLAIHHILKHRGHFLFVGNFENVTSFSNIFQTLKHRLKDEMGLDIQCQSESDLSEVLKDRNLSRSDKQKKVLQLLNYASDANTKKQVKAIIGLICGLKGKLSDVFLDESLKDIDNPSFSFTETPYEELRVSLEEVLAERCAMIDDIKLVHDWAVLADILSGGEYNNQSYLSIAKVKSFKKHHEDLRKLKTIVKKYCPDEYSKFFQKAVEEKKYYNYCAYIGSTLKAGNYITVKKCTQDEFYKSVKKLLHQAVENGLTEEKEKEILQEMEVQTFLPLQVTRDNGVIPYQVHEIELKKILENVAKYYSFLNKKGADGYSIADKIVMLFEFRIPYYVGPINTAIGKNSWMVRKEPGKILPWNFSEKVDIDESAEKFIRRMTNKCTYLIGEDVLPKNSLLYSEFMAWNELNNVRIKSQKMPIELKKKVFEDVFKSKKRVTRKMFLNALKAEGLEITKDEISGVDGDFKTSLSSYIDMQHIFGDAIKQKDVQDMCEQLILWITLYHDDVKMLRRVIRKVYNQDKITDCQLKNVCHLNYQGWGRLSAKLLTEIEGANTETGEVFNIISALRNTNDNLMQLLGQMYTFSNKVQEENIQNMSDVHIVSYDSLIRELPASPAVKRAVWQVVLIADEIKKIMHKEPKKIFLEMARGPEEKKRTVSRKDRLLNLYSKIKDDGAKWKEELEQHNESDFRSIKLYLYYTQMGKCMYSGDSIDLSQLADTNIYDRDHIYPQSKTKDDGLDNLVLAKKTLNSAKSDKGISPETQKKMKGFWKMLKANGLISEEKYNRLTRTTPLSEEELASFINRQLVETRQSSKILAELFKQLYCNSDIVYVKAKAVADFRQENLNMVKVRSLNDFHHAKDAYLNIVVGNVYHEKFTSNPLQWLHKHRNEKYSLNRLFDYDLTKGKGNDVRTIWKRGNDGTIADVKKMVSRNDILYTRQATRIQSGQNGGLFDQNIVSKTKNPSVPIKKGMDVKKYGGYNAVTPACFALVESRNRRGALQRSIEAVPLYLKNRIDEDESVYVDFCKDVLGLIEPRIVIPEIKKNAYIKVNGFPMHLRGRSTTGKQILLQGAVQLCLDEKYECYLKKLEKYIQRNSERNSTRQSLSITEHDGLTSSENIVLYDEICHKLRDTIYKYRPANPCSTLLNKREKFINLTVENQCMVLNEILHLLQCKPGSVANLLLLDAAKGAGKIQLNNVISKANQAILIHQSVTGLFEQTVDLLAVK